MAAFGGIAGDAFDVAWALPLSFRLAQWEVVALDGVDVRVAGTLIFCRLTLARLPS